MLSNWFFVSAKIQSLKLIVWQIFLKLILTDKTKLSKTPDNSVPMGKPLFFFIKFSIIKSVLFIKFSVIKTVSIYCVNQFFFQNVCRPLYGMHGTSNILFGGGDVI